MSAVDVKELEAALENVRDKVGPVTFTIKGPPDTVDAVADALRATPALIAALRIAVEALREAADEINRLDPHIQHPSGTGYDAGPALAQIAALVRVGERGK